MIKLLGVILALCLAGCSQLGSMASYSVSEAEMEQMLSQQIPALARRATVAGIPLSLQVEKMQVDIGPDKSDLIRLDTAASAVVSLFGLTYPANLQLQLEGSPYYDAVEQAVYLRSVRLLNADIEASGYRGNLKPVSNELYKLLDAYLATHPVYKLDTSKPALKVLAAVPLNMAVEQGQVRFTAKR